MAILVTGGAGYIGSHTVKVLLDAGRQVIVYDNLTTGFRKAVDPRAELIVGNLQDSARLMTVLREKKIDSVVHFAASSQVGESMVDPGKYYENNMGGTISLLSAMRDCGVDKLVFSSTAATYGDPEQVPILETCPTRPTNVYGRTKLMMEQALMDYNNAYGLRSISLRYFNAAGAHTSGLIGEAHSPETHLVPLAVYAALGQRPYLGIFGTDYPTKDGTCVRDYIHVIDLAAAHVLALDSLYDGAPTDVYNLGNGNGFTVREVIKMVEKVSGRIVPCKEEPRRAGDPAVLVASSEKIIRALGWKPQYADLEQVVASAWNFHIKHPNGY